MDQVIATDANEPERLNSLREPALPMVKSTIRREPSTKASFPPVGAVQRGLEILRSVSRRQIATVTEIHRDTGVPKPTIVRMLETLIHDGYVLRDRMCGGYRITRKTGELHSGYAGISRL